MSARGFIGAGDLYIARYSPAIGGFEGLKGPFEATKFEIKPNTETKEMESKGRDSYGQVIESVVLPKPSDFAITLAEMNRDAIAIALMGTTTTINQGSGTIASGTPIQVAPKIGEWVEMPHQNWATAAFVVADDGTPYVLGTDYDVNYRLGWLRAIPGSALATAISEYAGEGDYEVDVSGSYNAISGSLISGATASEIRARFVLDGINFVDKLPVIVNAWEGIIAPDAAVDFLQDEFAQLPLTGRLKTPVGKTEPFTVEMRDTA